MICGHSLTNFYSSFLKKKLATVSCIPLTVTYSSADDLKLYNAEKTTNQHEALKNNLGTVWQQLNTWQLSINPTKSNVLHLGLDNPNFSYDLNGTEIETSSSVTDLIILFSDDLKVRPHCAKKTRSAYYKLRQVYLSFECKEKTFQVALYKMFVRPILEFNTQIWSPHLIMDIDTVERVQNDLQVASRDYENIF